MTTRRIVLGVDGSEGAASAVSWCREHAPVLDAEVIATYVIDLIPLIGSRPTTSGQATRICGATSTTS